MLGIDPPMKLEFNLPYLLSLANLRIILEFRSLIDGGMHSG